MPTPHPSRLLALAGLLLAPLLVAGPASADQVGGGANNLVSVSPTADSAYAARGQVQVATYGGPSVQSTNLARATPWACTGCEARAAAIQGVIVTGNLAAVAPANAAVSINTACTSCAAYAYARQHVVSASRPVVLGAESLRRIADLQVSIDALLRDRDLPIHVLESELDRLAGELEALLVRAVADSGASVRGAAVARVVEHS